MTIELTGINRYPIKSCRGQRVERAETLPWGLDGDRRWMLVDHDGDVVTARAHPRLVLVTPELTADGLLVRGPGAEPLRIARPPTDAGSGGGLLATRVFGNPVAASPAGLEAAGWFSALLDKPVRLVYLDDPTRRRPNPAYSRLEDRVSFADGYPVLLTTEESLATLNDLVATGPHAGEGPLPMTRFRPNLVVHGAPAWAEDGWRRIRVGRTVFRVVKGCSRCVLTTVHPDTAATGREPLVTLARHRRWDGKVWFGMNLIPDSPGSGSGISPLRIGDPVEVLEAVRRD